MDAGAALVELAARFGVPCWWGTYTRAYWAMVPASGRWRLVEALTLRELAVAIQASDGWPWP
ncbi:hypothetical protein [Actinomadura napierensis]|jgi:hypothetical protein|uniref:Uncharacterized protein n=1 Tax=Actinomadura napierensis TaxID=267854 RepID=A0ABN3A9B0_9ACTN|nr:hypothetical protein [Spirillospora sp.]